MKNPLIFIVFLMPFLAGCATNQEVEQIKIQNELLKQQIQYQQEYTKPTTSSPAPTTTRTEYPSQSKPINPPSRSYEAVDSTPQYTETQEPSYTKTSCCKHCTKGKACGDSCININYTCHKGVGCACD